MIIDFDGDELSVTVDTHRGGRLTSLRGRDGFEWLHQVDQPLFGWNEVAPSISPVRLPDGGLVPDHGDAMRLPWQILENSSLALDANVRLTSVPVKLARRITPTPGGLTVNYRAETHSVSPIPFLWSAHPLFEGQGALIEGLETLSAIEEYPRRGATWAALPNDPFEFLADGSSLKVFPNGNPEHVALSRAGRTLHIRWSATELPWVGLFWDAGEFVSGRCIAIEPSTGYGDSLRDASASSRVLTVSQTHPLGWTLELTTTPRTAAGIPHISSVSRSC